MAPEGATKTNQAPEGEISTMVVVKWSDAVEGAIVKLDGLGMSTVYLVFLWPIDV